MLAALPVYYFGPSSEALVVGRQDAPGPHSQDGCVTLH